MDNKSKLTAALIGAGKIGGALARGLSSAGYRLECIASKPHQSAAALADEVGAKAIQPPYCELNETSLVFICVPDDEIMNVSCELADSGVDWRGKTVFHTSGALTSEELAPLSGSGAVCGSLHPLQTFPPGSGAERFRGVFFAVEGEAYDLGAEIATSLGGIPFRLKAEGKTLYHAAAVMAGNFIAVLAAAGRDILSAAGINAEGWRMLIPLMYGTLDSLKEYGIEEGFTGPIARGDTETVARHLESIKAKEELLALYKILARYSLKLADMPEEKRKEFGRILEGGL